MRKIEMNRRLFCQFVSTAAMPMPTMLAQSEDLFQPVRALLTGTEPVTWLFTGDSITHGALHTMGWRSYPEHFAERVRWELRRMRDVVINTGISGDRMTGLLKDAEWRVYRFQPQVVSLMMGMNDCVAGPDGRALYRTGLESFLQETQKRNSLLLLNSPNPIYSLDATKERRNDLPAYVDILRKFAEEKKLPLVDHYRHWSETRKDTYELLYLLSDGSVHPNQYGHSKMANLLFRKLGIFDPATSRTCRMFVP
jgi:acyl-CoA thioesterase-1